MIMVGQHKRLEEAKPLAPVQRAIVRGLALLGVAATVLVVVLVLTGSGKAHARRCVTLGVPSTTGGAQLQWCGGQATAVCADPASAGLGPLLTDAVRDRCRGAGYR